MRGQREQGDAELAGRGRMELPAETTPMTAAPADSGQSVEGRGRLVTVFGGTGFLGRLVVRHLLDRGFRVRAVARHPERAGAPRRAWRRSVPMCTTRPRSLCSRRLRGRQRRQLLDDAREPGPRQLSPSAGAGRGCSQHADDVAQASASAGHRYYESAARSYTYAEPSASPIRSHSRWLLPLPFALRRRWPSCPSSCPAPRSLAAKSR
jgi:hypothetical protein